MSTSLSRFYPDGTERQVAAYSRSTPESRPGSEWDYLTRGEASGAYSALHSGYDPVDIRIRLDTGCPTTGNLSLCWGPMLTVAEFLAWFRGAK